ncbi:MAG: hypothetical protein JKY15_00175, partial [Deltaproteobacteria bacterium]|nr:hypothetical protein [Deltaproteobacteria bacterium]
MRFNPGSSAPLGVRGVHSPVSQDAYLLAADIYQTGRQKGITIRSSTDCLISALAIRAKLPVW